MSDLPNTNDAVASEWVRRAKLVYDRGPRALGAGDSKLAVKDYATAAELALNAVYIKHGKHYLRTHNIGDLVQQCPDPTVRDAVEGYPGQFIRLFSQNCLAPYVRAHPVPEEEVEQCREFSRRIVGWAAGAVNP